MTVLGGVDEVNQFLGDVPEPKRGGTWLYCPWSEFDVARMQVTRCTFRTRRWKTWRRHWRR